MFMYTSWLEEEPCDPMDPWAEPLRWSVTPSGDLGSEEDEDRPAKREKLPLPEVPRLLPGPPKAKEGGGVEEEDPPPLK